MTTRTRPSTAKAKAKETPAAKLKQAQAQAKREHWELWLLRDIRAAHLPEPERGADNRGYYWHPMRDYHSEFAYPDPRTMLLLEVDGGLNVGRRNRKQQAKDAQEEALAALAGVALKRPPRGGGHASPDGYEHDRIRDAEAIIHGWTVLRVTPGMVERGEAVRYLELTLRRLWQRNGEKAA